MSSDFLPVPPEETDDTGTTDDTENTEDTATTDDTDITDDTATAEDTATTDDTATTEAIATADDTATTDDTDITDDTATTEAIATIDEAGGTGTLSDEEAVLAGMETIDEPPAELKQSATLTAKPADDENREKTPEPSTRETADKTPPPKSRPKPKPKFQQKPLTDRRMPRPVSPPAKRQSPPTGPSVIIRYGLLNLTGQFRHNLTPAPRIGQKVVIRSERGVEIGQVISSVTEQSPCDCRDITPKRLEEFLDDVGEEYPFRRAGRVLRLANHQDLVEARHFSDSAKQAVAFCRKQISEFNLKMRIVTVEHLLGGERILFYFSADTRVDFRELVRTLASRFRTRIEMRQVGSRDEARLVGDYERCGLQCCCRKFLKYLKPVSMRMAKVQKATLDPAKISGRCGRLMCCLRYEDEVYTELKKKLPRRKSWIRTGEGVFGQVMNTQIITQLIQINLPDGSPAVVANEDITERDLPEPPPRPEVKPRRTQPQRPRKSNNANVKAARDANGKDQKKSSTSSQPAGQAGQSNANSKNKRGKRKNRRRGNRGKSE